MSLSRRSRTSALAAVLVLAGGAGAFVATRSEKPLIDGSLRVTPSELALAGATPGTLTVANIGSTAITIEVAGPTWTAIDPVTALIAPGESARVQVRAIAEPAAGDAAAGDAAVEITAGADHVSVPITVSGAVTAGETVAGPKLVIDDAAVDFGETQSAIDRTISNPGSEVLTWTTKITGSWLRIDPSAGTVEPGAIVAVHLSAVRARLSAGESAGTVAISSNGGSGTWGATITAGNGPVLNLPNPTLDFGLGGRKAVKTKTFTILNAGRTQLRYQASVDRVFLRLGAGASGAVAPGGTAEVELTFDYRETRVSYDWVAEVPITSNGGSAVLHVVAVSDWSGPTMVVRSNEMKFAHDHCSGGTCERFRHLHATVGDPSKVILVEAAFQICAGSDQSPTCDEWRLAGKARRLSGDVYKGVYEMEVGPLPKTCIPGVGVIVHYRLRLADSLRNSVLRPGSATYYGYLHCSRAT